MKTKIIVVWIMLNLICFYSSTAEAGERRNTQFAHEKITIALLAGEVVQLEYRDFNKRLEYFLSIEDILDATDAEEIMSLLSEVSKEVNYAYFILKDGNKLEIFSTESIRKRDYQHLFLLR